MRCEGTSSASRLSYRSKREVLSPLFARHRNRQMQLCLTLAWSWESPTLILKMLILLLHTVSERARSSKYSIRI